MIAIACQGCDLQGHATLQFAVRILRATHLLCTVARAGVNDIPVHSRKTRKHEHITVLYRTLQLAEIWFSPYPPTVSRFCLFQEELWVVPQGQFPNLIPERDANPV